MGSKFKTKNIGETEMIYSLLRERYPERQIEIEYNDNTKEYVLNLTDIPYKEDPEVPLDVKVTVIYGDSITGDTPLLLKDPATGLVHIETIERIFDEDNKVEYPGFKMFDKTIRLEKEYSSTHFQAWTDIGWVNIKKVIRHKTDKKIFRVLTHTGCVDVSEDHSLIRENLEMVKPDELQIGDTLLHSFPTTFTENAETIVRMNKNIEEYILTKQEAEVWGMFQANGSAQVHMKCWKKAVGFSEYEVSSSGDIRNIKTGRLLKPQENGTYHVVSMRQGVNQPTTKRVHRIVAETFIENPEQKTTVNHLNHNPHDNKVQNLEWASMKEQNQHKTVNMKNVNGKKVNQYDMEMNLIHTFDSANDAMRITNIPASSIIYTCNNNNPSCHGYIWRYVENATQDNEVWKTIQINNNSFTVSNKGRVKTRKGVVSHGSLENSGYYRVKSVENGVQERVSVHVLVAKAFLPNDNVSYNIVNHIDSDKTNNHLENLEWCNQSQNMLHHKSSKGKYKKDTLLQDDDVDKVFEWTIEHQNLDRLHYFKDILENVEPVKFEILDTLESSGVYKLVPKGSIKYMTDKYRKLFYYQFDCNADGDKYKIVPNCILNASKEIKRAFFYGYYEADGSKTEIKTSLNKPSFAIKGKIGAQCLYYLTRSIGFDMGVQLYNHPKKQEMYRMDYTNFKRVSENVVKKMFFKRQSNNSEFIYDLETDIGRYNCGVGQLQATNTDSIFTSIKFNRDDFKKNREDAFKLGTICSDNITDTVFKRPPIVLEFEKVFQPFILLTKKRYIGKKFEDTRDPFKLKEITKSGIATMRRDYCKMVKDCYSEVIDCMVNEDGGGVQESVDIFKSYIDRIDNYQIDVDDLVVSAMLAKSYKTRPVHVQLAEKMKARKQEVQVGDRLQYIFIENTTNTVKQKSELGEDPDYAKKNNLRYNRKCYLEQLSKPLCGFFKVVLKNDPEMLDDVLTYVNAKLIDYGGTKLKASDYQLE